MKILCNAFLCLLAGMLFAGCAKNSSDRFQGYIEGEYVYVASPFGGALTNLAVVRGESVKVGQLLFELDREPEAASLDQAQKNLAQARAQFEDLTKGKRPSEIDALAAQLEQAKASLKLAEAELHRREKLVDSKVISLEEIDQARTQRDLAAARVTQLQADIETARLGGRMDAIRAAQATVDSQRAAFEKAQWAYDQKQQFAPTNALVHDTLYRSGEWVGAGNPVVVLLPPANLKVRFFVSETMLPKIKIGQSVTIQCDGATQPFKATVNYISTKAEYTPPVIYSRETRANLVYMIEAVFAPSEAAKLRPGQPADVSLDQ